MIVLFFLVVVPRVILAGMIVLFRFVIVEFGSVVARFGFTGTSLSVRAGVSAADSMLVINNLFIVCKLDVIYGCSTTFHRRIKSPFP